MDKFGYSTRYENLGKELISHILGFKDGEENFTASMNYVMSNLLYHHCLDVNSHYVERSLQGISFKMGIHGHQKKADRLRSLTKQFLASPVLKNQGDLKWSLLLVLIELGHHPARDSLSSSITSEVNVTSDFVDPNDTDNSDWIAELMEKSAHLHDKDETLSEWSDEDETKQSLSVAMEMGEPLMRRTSVNRGGGGGAGGGSQLRKGIEERERRNLMVKDFYLAKSWLANALQKPYWEQNSDKLVLSSTIHSVHDDVTQLSEYCVLRECAWVCGHPAAHGFVFELKGHTFETRAGVCLPTLSSPSLRRLLWPVSSAATKLHQLDLWLRDTLYLTLREKGGHWGTWQCYSDGLRRWRGEFSAKVVGLETNIVEYFEQDSEGTWNEGGIPPPTLLWFLGELEPSFSSLATIHRIHSATFLEPPRHEVGLEASFKLLSLLVQCSETRPLRSLLAPSLKGHLRTLTSLLSLSSEGMSSHSRGHAWDKRGLALFGIERRKVDGNNGEKVDRFVLYDRNDGIKLPGLNFLRALRLPLIQICNLREIVPDFEFQTDEEFDSDYLENLLEREIWSKFEGRSDNEEKRERGEREEGDDVYEEKEGISVALEGSCRGDTSTQGERGDDSIREEEGVGNSVKEEGRVDSSTREEGRLDTSTKGEERLDTSTKGEENEEEKKELEPGRDSQMLKLFDEDPFLEKAFEEEEEEEERGRSEEEEDQRAPPHPLCHSWLGLEHRLTSVLLPVVQGRYVSLGRMMLRALVRPPGGALGAQVRVLKGLCLLLAWPPGGARAVHEFCSHLFRKMDGPDPIEEGDLTQNLRLCIASSFPDMARRFCVTLRKDRGRGVLDGIAIDVTDLWPLSLVLSASSLSKYNAVFSFCLSLNRAMLIIHELRFKDMASFESCYSRDPDDDSSPLPPPSMEDPSSPPAPLLPLPQRLHRLQLLRQWLLYFSRLLHDHFNSAVLVPFSREVDRLLDGGEGEGGHLQHFIQEHDRLLALVCRQCFLTEEQLSPIQNVLAQMFSTVDRVRALWLGQVAHITEPALSQLEEQYSTCHRCMATFFSSLAATGACPLVEGLSHCLAYNCPT